MKKSYLKFISVIGIVLIMFSALSTAASADWSTDGKYKYAIYGEEAVIIGCSASASGAMEIPKTLGGYPVTTIDSYAFESRNYIESITIPDSVTTIGTYAFMSCTDLKSITIPDSVTSIEMGAFYYCTSLENITIPDSVTSIDDWVFSECVALKSITIPSSITSIGEGAFCGCISLESISIPNNVTIIGNGAFSGCTSLKNIIMPNSVTSIGNGAFSGCISLKDVYFTGTEEEWEELTISDGNDELEGATIHFNYKLNQNTSSSVVDAVYSSSTVTAHIDVDNIGTSVNLYVALYGNNNKLLGLHEEKISSDVENKEITFSNVPSATQYTVKVMLWDDNFAPICKASEKLFN